MARNMGNKTAEPIGRPKTRVEWVIHKLANAFNGLHWLLGITTLPGNATPREEQSFVLMWLGIVVLVVGFSAFMLYLL